MSDFPIRSCGTPNSTHPLYAHPATFNCATTLAKAPVSKKQKKKASQSRPQPCIACAYKLLTPDITRDKLFTSQTPNVRPENCPRHSQEVSEIPDVYTGNVLCVGDGDLSFGAALANSLKKSAASPTATAASPTATSPKKRSLDDSNEATTATTSSTTSVITSSLESLATLESVYGADLIAANVAAVTAAKAHFQVDCTALAATLPTPLPQIDTIAWNFPCTAEANGQDGQNSEMDKNKELLVAFVRSAGLVGASRLVITHKTKPPFNHWSIVEVVEGAGGFKCKGRIVFDKSLYVG